MKFSITFKTPDALSGAMDGMESRLEESPTEEQQIEIEDTKEAMEKVGKKFIRYGEYVSIEFDTETLTAKVLPA